MKKTLLLSFLLILSSCIPIKIAPKIEDYRIVVAKRFKRDLAREYAFVFEDYKNADEFYHFINAKFNLQFEEVETNVPILVDDHLFFMSFHEREKTTEVGNLIPVIIDGILDSEGVDPILESSYSSRKSHWYILITVRDAEFRDCLSPHHLYRERVVANLQELKDEYLSTQNYAEAFFRKK